MNAAIRVCIAVGSLGLFVAAGPAAALPCAGFTDVEDTSPFCANVEWMRNRGITQGCTATQYCPDSNVTRLQMAAFFARLNKYLGHYFTDATGAYIGKQIEIDDRWGVELIVGGRLTLTGISEGGFTLSGTLPTQAPYFESTDCTGPAYSTRVRPGEHAFWGRHRTVGLTADGRGVVYFLSDLPVGEPRQMRSFMSSIGSCFAASQSGNVVPFPPPLPPLYDLPQFVPPFTLH